MKNFFLLACLAFPIFCQTVEEINLELFEQKIYSQNGEDGVLRHIFDVIGTTSKHFVEFGVQDGSECNTRYFREMFGWVGLMMDLGEENLQHEYIKAENINDLFQKYNVPKEFDLLSIDIDFNDFYIWQALGSNYHPRVVVIEYNATHSPEEDKISIYDPDGNWDGTNYYGASILALHNLAQKLGYSLVYADQRGVNLFFIRNDVLENCPNKFLNVNNVEKLYKPPRYSNGPNNGHPADPRNREYVSSQEILNR